MKLSAVVLSKNEENHIEDTLRSLLFCDEIVLIDNFSTNRTVKIAKQYRAKVFQKELNNNFSTLRNYGMKRVRGEWVLFLDADEEVSPELAQEAKKITKTTHGKTAYYIKRRDFWWGKEMKYGEAKEVRNIGIIRLVKKNSGKWQGSVHEVFVSQGSTGKLDGFINHFPHKTLAEFVSDINFYSTLRAKELVKSKKGINIFTIILYPLGKFISTYLLKMGFLDGVQGFAYSFLMSFHSFLVRAKQYQYTKLN